MKKNVMFMHKRRRFLYVLNADPNGGNPNITGFILNHDGTLTPLAGSTRSLNPGAYSQVGFSSHGRELIVTERSACRGS